MAYVAPNWKNDAAPALDAEALNAISQALAKLPMENGGTFATSGAAGLYNLINAAATLTSSTLASGDYVGVQDVSAGTGKRTTRSNLASWIGSNGTGAKIAMGSYTGTGTYGASKPNSITFPFTPKLVWLYHFYNGSWTSAPIESYGGSSVKRNVTVLDFTGLSTSYVKSRGFMFSIPSPNSSSTYDSSAYAKKSGNSLYWYNTYDSGQQCNMSSATYKWIAIG